MQTNMSNMSPSLETVVEAVEVCGKCEVVCGEDIEGDRDEWFSAAPNRFYFFEVNICCSCAVVYVWTHGQVPVFKLSVM